MTIARTRAPCAQMRRGVRPRRRRNGQIRTLISRDRCIHFRPGSSPCKRDAATPIRPPARRRDLGLPPSLTIIRRPCAGRGLSQTCVVRCHFVPDDRSGWAPACAGATIRVSFSTARASATPAQRPKAVKRARRVNRARGPRRPCRAPGRCPRRPCSFPPCPSRPLRQRRSRPRAGSASGRTRALPG